MQITLRRVNDKVHLVAENRAGNTIDIDGSPRIGGEDAGFRPMELVLAAIAGCGSMDLIPILAKQRQRLDDYRVIVDGERKADSTPSPFISIHMHFELTGRITESAARKAVDLAVEKYCSVAEMLKQTVNITWDFEILPPGVVSDDE